MKLKKKIAAMGAAVMIMASMSAIGASAYQASYEDSYRIILAYTSYTPSETDSVGTVTNLSTTKQITLYSQPFITRLLQQKSVLILLLDGKMVRCPKVSF